MLTQSEVSAIVFFVTDLERTEAFYSTVLGLETTVMNGHDGAFMTASTGALTLVFLPSNDATPGRSPVVVFGLDGGIEDMVESLANQKVEIVVPVSEAPDGGLTADFLDPDGHTLSLYQSAEAPRRTQLETK